jgi:hypothetical protein
MAGGCCAGQFEVQAVRIIMKPFGKVYLWPSRLLRAGADSVLDASMRQIRRPGMLRVPINLDL